MTSSATRTTCLTMSTVAALTLGLFNAANAYGDQVVYDHFDDGVLDSAWDIVLEYADGWTYSESGTLLTVTDISPTFINPDPNGTIWAIVRLTQSCAPLGDFQVEFSFSWDSEGDNRAMQLVWVSLYAVNGDLVARGGYCDGWVGHRGCKYADICGSTWHSGTDTLPLFGNASVGIDRNGDLVTVSWDGTPVFSGVCALPVEDVEVSFQYFAYDYQYQGQTTSFFGSESVDVISVAGAPDWSAYPDPQDDTTDGDEGDISGTSADPVNTATGSFFHQETDLSIPSRGLPLTFTRFYNSKAAAPGRKAGKAKQAPPVRKAATSQPASPKDGEPSSVDAKKHEESAASKDQKQTAGSSQARLKTKEEGK